MANLCPITGTRVVYLDCLECDDKVCKSGQTSPVVQQPPSRKYRCNCCGLIFDEPYGMFEKLRCPDCDAVFEEGMDYIEEWDGD
jgi:rubredoxin